MTLNNVRNWRSAQKPSATLWWQFCDWRLFCGHYILGIRCCLYSKGVPLHCQRFHGQQCIAKHGKCSKITDLKIKLSKCPKPGGSRTWQYLYKYKATPKPKAALIVLSLTICNLFLGIGHWLTGGFSWFLSLLISQDFYFLCQIMSVYLSTITGSSPPTLAKCWFFEWMYQVSSEPYLHVCTVYWQRCVRAHTIAVAQLASCALTGPSLIAFDHVGALAHPSRDHSCFLYTSPNSV